MEGAYPVDESPVPDFDEEGVSSKHPAEEAVLVNLGVGRRDGVLPAKELELPFAPPRRGQVRFAVRGFVPDGRGRAAPRHELLAILGSLHGRVAPGRIFEVLPRRWSPTRRGPLGTRLVAVDQCAAGKQAHDDGGLEESPDSHVGGDVGIARGVS